MRQKASRGYLILVPLVLMALSTSCGSDEREERPFSPARTASLLVGPLEPGEQLGANHYTLSFGSESVGNDHLDGTGVLLHGAYASPPGVSLRFFNGAGSQANGSYQIAFKNESAHTERISATFPNIVPEYRGPLAGGGVFDGTALWLGHSRFQTNAAPPMGSDSPPTIGKLWNGEDGTADKGTDVRADDAHLIAIPVIQNQVTRQSYLVSAQVYAPKHDLASHHLRAQPFLAREAGGGLFGLTTPGGLGFEQIDLTPVLDRWALLQVRADISTDGGSLPEPSDDAGRVVYRYFLDGAQVAGPVSLAFDAQAMQDPSHTGSIVFSPAFGLTYGWASDAAEVFVDDIATDSIIGNTSEFVMTSPQQQATVTGVTELRVSLGSIAPRVANVEYTQGAHSLGIQWEAPYALDWNSRFVDDGPVRFTATARDTMGNVLASVQRDIVVRNLGNAIRVVSPSSLDDVLSGPVRITVEATDAQYYPFRWDMYIDGEIVNDLVPGNTQSHTATAMFELDTTRFRNGTHELYIHVHSIGARGEVFNNRMNIGPRSITIGNSSNSRQEISLNWQHLYLRPGEGGDLVCTQRYADGSSGPCSGVSYVSDQPGVVEVREDGKLLAKSGADGFATITASVGSRPTDTTSARVWVRPHRHLAHFGKDGSLLTSYTPDKSLYMTAPFYLEPKIMDEKLLAETRKAGVNTLWSSLYSDAANINKCFNQWKGEFHSNFESQWAQAKDFGFSMFVVGDGILRVPARDAWITLNWRGDPNADCSVDAGSVDAGSPELLGKLAVKHVMQRAAAAGNVIGVDMVDEASMSWGDTPYPKAKAGDTCMLQSIDCTSSTTCPHSPEPCYADRCRVNWLVGSCKDEKTLEHHLYSDHPSLRYHFVLFDTSNHLSTPGGTTFLAENVGSSGFEFAPPAHVPVGNYKDGIEWSLFWPVDGRYGECRRSADDIACNPHVPNDAIATISGWMREESSRIPMSWPTLGIADGYNAAVPGNWYGKGAPADYASHYFDVEDPRRTYPWSWSIQQSAFWMRKRFYDRQNSMDLGHPQIVVSSLMGQQYIVGSGRVPHDRMFDPAVDQLEARGTSPQAIIAGMLTGAAIGNAGTRLYNLETYDLWNGRATAPKGTSLQTGANPFFAEISHWRAMAYGANALTKVLAPYLLSDVLDAPSLGQNVVVAARQGSDARMLLAVNARDWPRDLDVPLGSAGSFDVLRYRIGPHAIEVTRLADGAVTDRVSLEPGEGVAYLMYASAGGSSGAVSDKAFPAPNLPPTATSAVLRTSYIYGDELTKRTGGGILCTTGCTMPIDQRLGTVFAQYTFLADTGAIVGKSPVITPLQQ